MRPLSLERKVLLLVLIPAIGGLIPALFIIKRAHAEVLELRALGLLAETVWKLGDLDQRIDAESSNWYAFKPTWVCTDEVRRAEREKQETARRASDAAIEVYQNQRALIDAATLSLPLKSALSAIDQRIADLPTLRQRVYNQVKDSDSVPILEGYHGTRRDISSVLPFLVDATTNDVVVRKLSVLSKLMLARKNHHRCRRRGLLHSPTPRREKQPQACALRDLRDAQRRQPRRGLLAGCPCLEPRRPARPPRRPP